MFKTKEFKKAATLAAMITTFIAGIITFIIGLYFIYATASYGISVQIMFYGIFWSSFLYLGISILYFIFKLINKSKIKHQKNLEKKYNDESKQTY